MLKVPAIWLGRLLVLPVDLLFVVIDVIFVNLKKTGIFGEDCRGTFGGGSCPCGPARKYINHVLFKLVCRDVRFAREEVLPTCTVEERPRIYFIRGGLSLAVIAALALGVAWGIVRLWPRVTPETPTGVEAAELLAERLDAAAVALEAGHYEDALASFQAALRLAPDDKELHYKAGLCLEAMGERVRAVPYFVRAARGDDAHAPAAGKMALYLYEKGNVGQAGDFARHAVNMGADDGWTLAILADREVWANDLESAGILLREALAKSPDDEIIRLARAHLLIAQDDLDEGEKLLDGLPEDTSVALLAAVYRLDLLRRRGRPADALDQLKEVAERNADVAWPSLLLTDFLFGLGQRREAVKRAESLSEKFSYAPDVWLALAQTLVKHGEDDAALRLAYQCTAEPALAVSANLLLGNIYLRRGFNKAAQHSAGQALTYDPDNRNALLLAGQAALALGEMDEAIRQLRRAVHTSATDPDAYYLLARAQAAAGEREDSLESLEQACELRPDAGLFHYDCGMTLVSLGRTEEGVEHLSKAAELLRDPYDAFTKLGLLAHESGDKEQAKAYYAQAVDANPARALVASNNLAQMLLADDEDTSVALALAYAAYANSAGLALRHHTSDTFATALIKAGYPARALEPARQAAAAEPDNAGRQLRLAIAEIAVGNAQQARAACGRVFQLAPDSEAAEAAKEVLEKLDQQGQGAPAEVGGPPDEQQ